MKRLCALRGAGRAGVLAVGVFDVLGLVKHDRGERHALVPLDVPAQESITGNDQAMCEDVSKALLAIRTVQHEHRQVRKKMRHLALPVPNKGRRADHQSCAGQRFDEGECLHRLSESHFIGKQGSLSAPSAFEQPCRTLDLIRSQLVLHCSQDGSWDV